jgi:hypothetical protein
MIPMCSKWKVALQVPSASLGPWYANALVLSNDGSIQALLPDNALPKLLSPGERYVFPGVLEAKPPVGVIEHVIVYLSRKPRALTSEQTSGKSPGELRGKYRDLSNWFKGGGDTNDTDKVTQLSIKIKANDSFSEATGEQIQQREYTIPKFDIRPYLPEDKNMALYRVLMQSQWLANFSAESGVGYKQHDWTGSNDSENLTKGIDCSRAIWFAFTRASLHYNKRNSYLSTAQMVSKNSLMQEEFDRVPLTSALQVGDVLVYRDESQGDGHVVMVVDPGERIGWGSHGYDGRVRTHEVVEPSIGVQYQKIRYKKDWLRWDRREMNLVAIWRYRQFSREHRLPGGQPGLKSLLHACDAEKHCGL